MDKQNYVFKFKTIRGGDDQMVGPVFTLFRPTTRKRVETGK